MYKNRKQAEQAANDLVEAFIGMLHSHLKSSDDEFLNEVSYIFIDRMVASVVYKTLKKASKRSLPKKQQYEEALKTFADAKHNVQEAVALGFTSAASAFCGRLVDYYCQLKVVPEAPSSEIC